MISEYIKCVTDEGIEECISRVYDRVTKLEPKLHAFITLVDKDTVINNAKQVRSRKLMGLPVAVKDNISTKGIRTTCGSRMLSEYVPVYDATVIERLASKGATILGKTNMDEFAMGSTTETSFFGPSRNPWDLTRVPGGSSGGSGVAIASKMVEIALGSDTGGSIRAPASFNGVYGLKPSYGTVSRYGLVAYANSLEQIGPMARNASDLKILFSIISGFDIKDATTVSFDKKDDVDIKLNGFRIGILKDIMDRSSPEVQNVMSSFIEKLSSEGALIEEVQLGYIDYILPAYYIIAMSEASSNLARFDGVRYGYGRYKEGTWIQTFSANRAEGFGSEVKKRILLGSFILSAGYYDEYYIKALKIRKLVKESVDNILKSHDVILSPTMPILPPKLGDVIDDPLKMYAMDLNTVVANLTGIPAVSVPVGFYQGLPVGAQFMGKYLNDFFLLNLVSEVEKITKMAELTPSI
ncbi:glutamyl-tRNA amidotransferase [Sulfolobales archaeon HS-7]|nr:glutamyl-tRNA amidotransferase [Sulfolobales archaeon HS-7]